MRLLRRAPGRALDAARRSLEQLGEDAEPEDADRVALTAWARLHLVAEDHDQLEPLRADLERVEALAVRRDAGRIGWGLGWAWDAFSDGTVNPRDTVYTYQTGLIGLMLLDAHEVLAEGRWLALARAAAAMIMEEASGWEDGEHFSVWFSDQEADQLPHLQKHDVNGLAAGLLARLGNERWRAAHAAMIEHLLAEQGAALPEDETPRTNWRFGAVREQPQGSIMHRPNDLVHECLILLGLADTSDPAAQAAVDAALADIAAYHFDERGVPREGVFTRGTRGWGPPAALFVLARRGSHRRAAARIARALAASVDARGRSSLVPANEPRAQGWYALALAAWASGGQPRRLAASP